MPPPPAEPFAARVFLGPALRAQPDRRLVKLVREGYESAFEEIVRRYRKPLDRFAAAIVGGRSEDVTQDAFSKALLALRGTTTEIELKPWLYRIVRNAALNEIRDSPPPTEELGAEIPGGRSAAVEAERREEIGELMGRLRALPEPQRAAIVMRELEGLSHEEIAAALGVSGGAARQAIYRARVTLRDGFGLMIPLPLLRLLFEHGVETAGAGTGAAVAATGAAAASGGTGATTLGGLGAVGALKVGLATAVLAGSVGAGVAIQRDRGGHGPEPAKASVTRLTADDEVSDGSGGGPGATPAPAVVAEGNRARGNSGPGDDEGRDRTSDDHSGHGGGGGSEDFDESSGHGGGPGPGPKDDSGHGGRGSGHGGRSGSGDDSGEDISGGSHSGRGGPSGSGSGSGGDSGSGGHGSSGSSGSSDSHGGGSGSGSGSEDHVSGSDDSGHGGDSGSSGGPTPTASPLPAPEPPPEVSDDGSGGGAPDS